MDKGARGGCAGGYPMKPKLVVGQKLFLVRQGNRGIAPACTFVSVSKVGRKYFSVVRDGQIHLETEFHLDDWRQRTEYAPDCVLYATEQEGLDAKEASKIRDYLHEIFSRYHSISSSLPLESLRKVRAIIETESKP